MTDDDSTGDLVDHRAARPAAPDLGVDGPRCGGRLRRLVCGRVALRGLRARDAQAAVGAWLARAGGCDTRAREQVRFGGASSRRCACEQVSALEDPVQAGAYEQALKRRPAAFGVKQRAAPAPGVGSALLGELEVTAAPLHTPSRPLRLFVPPPLSSPLLASPHASRCPPTRSPSRCAPSHSFPSAETPPRRSSRGASSATATRRRACRR